MNKLITEGKRLAELANEHSGTIETQWFNMERYEDFHLPETMLKIYSMIEDMREALKDADETIHSEFCSDTCHPLHKTKLVLKKWGME